MDGGIGPPGGNQRRGTKLLTLSTIFRTTRELIGVAALHPCRFWGQSRPTTPPARQSIPMPRRRCWGSESVSCFTEFDRSSSRHTESLCSTPHVIHCLTNKTDFHKAASEGVNLLIRLMYSDVRPLCADLFEKSWWRSRKCVKSIVATLKDYLENVFQDYLHDDFFQLLLSRSLRSLEIEYLRCVGCGMRTAQPRTVILYCPSLTSCCARADLCFRSVPR